MNPVQTWRAALPALRDSLPATESTGGGEDVAAHLRRLADAWLAATAGEAPEAAATALALDDRATIDAICRVVHVSKQTFARYRPGWKRDADAPPLGAEAWRLLIAVLAALAVGAELPGGDAGDGGSDEAGDQEARFDRRGLAWKCLNGALAAQRRAESLGVDGLAAMGADLRAQLAAVARSGAPIGTGRAA